MKLLSIKTFLEVCNQVGINVTAAWFAVLLVSPGFFGISSQQQYFETLIKNLPFGIVGLIISSLLAERIKSL